MGDVNVSVCPLCTELWGDDDSYLKTVFFLVCYHSIEPVNINPAGRQMCAQAPLWEIPMTWSEAAEWEDGTGWPARSLESTEVSPCIYVC